MQDITRGEHSNEYEQLSLDIGLAPSLVDTLWSQPDYTSDLAQQSFSRHHRALPIGENPRDRLLEVGASALSISELLSILVGTELGQPLLQMLNADGLDPLKRLQGITVEELTTVLGIGIAKATTMIAAIEVGKRVFLPKPEKLTVVDDPSVAVAALSQELMWQGQEKFAIVLLDIKHRLLGTHVVTVGTATETLAHPRDVFRVAISRGATRILIAHNHPSAAVEPSSEDLALTKQFLQSAEILGIPVLDHLILGGGEYRSLRATTALWQEYPSQK